MLFKEYMTISSARDFYGKKVLILGLGLHGGGVAGAYWFFRHGAEVIVTDLKSREQLAASIARLTALCNAYRLAHPAARLLSPEYVLGKHRKEDVVRADIIIQNPGVPRDMPLLVLARERGIPIHNDASIFFSLVQHTPLIGVTGTRGKTTTVTLIAELLKKRYPKALAAGYANPDGAVSFFSILDKACEHEQQGVRAPVALELSSWQLEVLGEHKKSPHVAVITNIYPDHLNRYLAMEQYVDAKKNIVRFMGESTHESGVVLNWDNPVTRTIGTEIPAARVYWFSRTSSNIERGAYVKKEQSRSRHGMITLRHDGIQDIVCQTTESGLKGMHNEENILAALVVGMIYGVDVSSCHDVCLSAQGVAGRLEYRGDIDGRAIYNDTAATSPDATRAALTTLTRSKTKRIILIAGGADKGLEFGAMADAIVRTCKALIVFSGTASPHIVDAVHDAGYDGALAYVHTMRQACERAWQASAKGDTILLSPGAASFGLFLHEFDRGAQFNDEIQKVAITND